MRHPRPARTIHHRYRSLTAAALAVIGAVLGGAVDDQPLAVDGTLYDLASYLSARPAGPEPVTIVALDADSLAAARFKGLPRSFYGPWFGEMTDALVTAGAQVVGFDLFFSYSAAEAAGANYDWRFKDAIARHLPRLVTVRTLRGPLADEWAAAFYDPEVDAAAGREEGSAIAYAELSLDADGVVRSFKPALQAGSANPLPTFVGTLLARAGAPLEQEFLMRPTNALERIPAYRFVDVLTCAETDPAALRKAFDGKVVIVGTNLPEEDRVRGPDRFFTPPRTALAPPSDRCVLERLGASSPETLTIPGMFAHAGAVRAVLRGEVAHLAPATARVTAYAGAGLLGALAGLTLAPWWAAAALVFVAALAGFGTVVLLASGIWLPPAGPMIFLGCAVAMAYLVRFFVEERRRRRVENAFSHYLAPLIVARLSEQDEALRLGGERREVTVMFADLSGFTALSERVDPETLMAVTNRYLELLVQAVELTGGYVDKFIGDAVMAVWGAPAADGEHALHAIEAAMAAVNLVDAMCRGDEARSAPAFSVKIGINTGEAVVGNVGAPHRYNYTAVGETVNVAARLEGLPGDYGCPIILGPGTAARLTNEYLLCEIDRVQVKGKTAPISVFWPITLTAEATPAERLYVERYETALEGYREGRFAEAAALWATLRNPRNSGKHPASVMAERARSMKPTPQWSGVWAKDTK